jgi:hypothetical protein
MSKERAIIFTEVVSVILDTHNDEISECVNGWFELNDIKEIDNASMRKFIRIFYFRD